MTDFNDQRAQCKDEKEMAMERRNSGAVNRTGHPGTNRAEGETKTGV